MRDNSVEFTVFTPTFNRAHTLCRVYESLLNQTYRNFEWLIVDDGSTDQTRELVDRWSTEAPFPIIYYFQENQGKHVAFNRGVKLAGGNLFLPMDSDDSMRQFALERLAYHWGNITSHEREKFSGITCLCEDERGRVVGDRFPKDVMDSDELAMRHRYKIRGEKWGFHRTDVLRKYPFPEIPNCSYVPESLVWNAIALRYRKRFVNEPLRIYYSAVRDERQITAQILNNPARHSLPRWMYHHNHLNECIGWMGSDPIGFARSAANYARFSFLRDICVTCQWKQLGNRRARFLWLAAVAVGWLAYRRDRQKDYKQWQ